MPFHPNEETALLEIKELAQHPLYQQTCAPDTPAGQSKTSINNALQKGIIPANTGGDCPRRLTFWQSATMELFSAGLQSLLEAHRRWNETKTANEAVREWRQLSDRLYQAQLTAASAVNYWQGWNDALNHAATTKAGAPPENPLPEPAPKD